VRRAACAAALCAGLVVGCGGGASNQDAVRAVINDYYQALSAGDGAGACNLLATDTVKSIEKAAKGRACKDVVNDELQQPDFARVAEQLKTAKVSKVTIAGDKAIAQTNVPHIRGRTVTTKVFLKKEGDSWKLISEPRQRP
jgi:ketosteroid isomerase-like protein